MDTEATNVQKFCDAGEVLDPVGGADACEGNYADDPESTNIYAQHTFGPARPRTAGVRLGYEF